MSRGTRYGREVNGTHLKLLPATRVLVTFFHPSFLLFLPTAFFPSFLPSFLLSFLPSFLPSSLPLSLAENVVTRSVGRTFARTCFAFLTGALLNRDPLAREPLHHGGGILTLLRQSEAVQRHESTPVCPKSSNPPAKFRWKSSSRSAEGSSLVYHLPSSLSLSLSILERNPSSPLSIKSYLFSTVVEQQLLSTEKRENINIPA